jgi:cell division protein FtsI (penicillin-binding protein 3)
VTQGTQITAPGRIELGNGSYIKDAWAHGDIRYTTAGALANSSNTGISLLSDRMSAEQRRDYMLKFGLNADTEVDFSGESSGNVPLTENWDPVTNYAVQFGQGITMTSAQVASIYQTLGNGGVRMPLTLVAGCTWPDGTVTELPTGEGTRAVSEQAADQTVQILESVVETGGLSGYLAVPGYRIAAKSGTAEVAENGAYGGERIISIAGVLPAENPQYAVVVTFGKPDTIRTSSAAASTFKKITTQIIKSFRIEPSTEQAPIIPLEW